MTEFRKHRIQVFLSERTSHVRNGVFVYACEFSGAELGFPEALRYADRHPGNPRPLEQKGFAVMCDETYGEHP